MIFTGVGTVCRPMKCLRTLSELLLKRELSVSVDDNKVLLFLMKSQEQLNCTSFQSKYGRKLRIPTTSLLNAIYLTKKLLLQNHETISSKPKESEMLWSELILNVSRSHHEETRNNFE